MNWRTKVYVGGLCADGTPSSRIENVQVTDLKARSTKTKQEVPCALEKIDEEAGEIWIEHEERDVEFSISVIADADLGLGPKMLMAPITMSVKFPEPEWIQLPLPFYEFEHYYDEDYDGTHFESEEE